jgi:predicted ThiF/HesA family dinucleotide-utilizing enzyme
MAEYYEHPLGLINMIETIEMNKNPRGKVTLVGLGRLGLRTALNLVQVHRGGPASLTVIDGQKISDDDVIFKPFGSVGDFKVIAFRKYMGYGLSKKIIAIPEYISVKNLGHISGDVICIEIAGGDTLPLTAAIIHHAQKLGAITISTMGVFGIGEEPIVTTDILSADTNNPIVSSLQSFGVHNHLLIGTGKLIRDWEPVTPYVLDRVSEIITREILKALHNKC